MDGESTSNRIHRCGSQSSPSRTGNRTHPFAELGAEMIHDRLMGCGFLWRVLPQGRFTSYCSSRIGFICALDKSECVRDCCAKRTVGGSVSRSVSECMLFRIVTRCPDYGEHLTGADPASGLNHTWISNSKGNNIKFTKPLISPRSACCWRRGWRLAGGGQAHRLEHTAGER
jgi:hypothetical protein